MPAQCEIDPEEQKLLQVYEDRRPEKLGPIVDIKAMGYERIGCIVGTVGIGGTVLASMVLQQFELSPSVYGVVMIISIAIIVALWLAHNKKVSAIQDAKYRIRQGVFFTIHYGYWSNNYNKLQKLTVELIKAIPASLCMQQVEDADIIICIQWMGYCSGQYYAQSEKIQGYEIGRATAYRVVCEITVYHRQQDGTLLKLQTDQVMGGDPPPTTPVGRYGFAADGLGSLPDIAPLVQMLGHIPIVKNS